MSYWVGQYFTYCKTFTCIQLISGQIYDSRSKYNACGFDLTQARLMFDGEMASLEAILQTATVKVPKPVKVIDMERGGAVFVMEHLDMGSLNRYHLSSHWLVVPIRRNFWCWIDFKKNCGMNTFNLLFTAGTLQSWASSWLTCTFTTRD